MGDAFSDLQAENILPPRQPLAFAIGTTSARKDLGALAINGIPVASGGALILTLYADVKWWFRTSPTDTGTVDETAIDALGAGLTIQPNAGVEILAGQPFEARFDRTTDRYLVIKGAAAGTMRGWASSETKGNS